MRESYRRPRRARRQRGGKVKRKKASKKRTTKGAVLRRSGGAHLALRSRLGRRRAERRLRFPHGAREFRANVVKIRRGSKQRFISTEEGNDGKTQILVHRNGSAGSSRSLSDGTLRFLALSIMCEDPSFRGLICMEEPENGIHPSKMEAMIRLLKDLPVDPFRAPGDDNPLRQVIVATHSPYFVQLQDRSDLLLATEARVRGPFDRPASTLRCRPLTDTWREEEKVRSVGLGTIIDYLTAPPEAQLTLDPDALPAAAPHSSTTTAVP